MSYATGLRCLKCGAQYPISKMFEGCPRCRTEKIKANLVVEYDYDRISTSLCRKSLEAPGQGIWRFRDLLPVDKEEHMVSCGEGNTPLIRCKRLGEEIGLKKLYIKDESRNPTWSFKDRLACTTISKGLDFRARVATVLSTGNQGAATAAYASRAGMDCVIFTLPDVPATMLTFMRIYGAKVVLLSTPEGLGVYPYDIIAKCVKEYGWFPACTIVLPPTGNPYGVEGYKTLGYEICIQMNWTAPDRVVIPCGYAEGLTGIWRGFSEFHRLGLLDSLPTMVAAETDSGNPLTYAAEKGLDYVEKVSTKPTVAFSIVTEISSYMGLKTIQESKGKAVSSSDQQILAMQRSLARKEGIFPEPSSATSLAVAKKLKEEGEIDRDETVVCIITSGGLKDPNAAETSTPPLPSIRPEWRAFTEFMKEYYHFSLTK
ncbi:MAG: threonine synthase [Nitrososphaeria archaeon]|nr:threonine synthase [Nitrososphaeria archaeon]NIN53116.1 threonine synthase [Nitrososphaeria archaeon]NIQ33882.1 threonine synthase [Nitrososphaeria archaeon]